MKKVKLFEIVETKGLFEEAIKQVVKRYKKDEADFTAEIGITKEQLSLVEKRMAEKIGKQLETTIRTKLLSGEGIELNGTLMIYASESKVDKNEKGFKKRKLTIRTREAMKRDLN